MNWHRLRERIPPGVGAAGRARPAFTGMAGRPVRLGQGAQEAGQVLWAGVGGGLVPGALQRGGGRGGLWAEERRGLTSMF